MIDWVAPIILGVTATLIVLIGWLYLRTTDKLDDIHGEVKSLHTRHDNADESHKAQEKHHSKLYRLMAALWEGDKQRFLDEWNNR